MSVTITAVVICGLERQEVSVTQPTTHSLNGYQGLCPYKLISLQAAFVCVAVCEAWN